MQIEGARVVAFDYSWVDGGTDSTTSSRTVSTDDAAVALDAFIRSLADSNSNVYSLHHSKGGAVGVSMILNGGSWRFMPSMKSRPFCEPLMSDARLVR